MINIVFDIVFPLLTSALFSWGLYIPARRLALHYGVVDHPNARRVNKKAVPVLGGVVIFTTAIFTILIFSWYLGVLFYTNIAVMMLAIMVLGVDDDRRDIRWTVKTLIELLIFWGLMKWSGLLIDDFHGLWGIDELPVWFSWGFTFMLFVGITNGVNLMDGVDGLSSGYGLVTTLLFGLYFLGEQALDFAMPAFVIFGAIVPFWIYNVFSRHKKMFMGDGGSLTLGLVLSVFAIKAIRTPDLESGIVSYVLAILAVPVFDTLRVMVVRVFNGRSPMSPDKSHLHHIFIDLGFGHLACSMIVICLNLVVVAVWWLCELLNTTIDTQFYAVFASGLFVTSGVYYFLSRIRKYTPARWTRWQVRVGGHNRLGTRIKLVISRIIDGK